MKKLLFSLLSVFMAVNLLSAQNIDSLQNILPKTIGKQRAEVLIDLAKNTTRKDSAQTVSYANEAITIGSELNEPSVIADAYYQIGETYYFFDSYQRAISSYSKAIELYSFLGDSANRGRCYHSIGVCNHYLGLFEVGIEELFKSLRIFETLGLKGEMARAYSNIGMVYSAVEDEQKAIKNYRKAAEVNLLIGDTSGLSVNYNGMGTSYFKMDNYDSSKVFYNKAYHLFKILGNRQWEAIALNNIANIYVNEGDSLTHALEFYIEALDVFRDINDKYSEAYTLEGLGGVYKELGRFKEAISTFELCVDISKKHQIGYYILELAYQDMSDAYEKTGQISKALESFKLYSLYSDSLLQEERINQVAELGEKYESEKKGAEIDRLKALDQVHQLQIQRNKQIRLFGIVIIILLVVITFVISVGYLNKKKINELLTQKNIQIELQRKELEKLNASKNKFFSIIAHDLKNPFHTVMGYSYLMYKDYKRFTDEEREKYAEDIYKSTNTIFRLLQNLLDWSRSQTGRITFNPQTFSFSDLYENIHGLLKPVADAKRVKLECVMEEGSFAFADPMMVETILRNLINNAIKFSYEGGIVKTSVCQENENLKICVKDDGVGIRKRDLDNLFRIDSKVKQKGTKNEDGSGLGLILCKEFIERNGGIITAESQSGEGSCFCVTLPTQKQS